MKKILVAILTLTFALTAGAQSADKLYREGKALYDAKKYTAAFPKLKTAAEKGHKKAQYRLGRCYDKGNGVEENDQQAFAWYQKAAAQGHTKAQYQLGKCYKDGEGVTKDRKKAFEWFAKAAQDGHAEAQYQVGKAYMKGKGTETDMKKAKAWLTKAVNNIDGGDEVMAKIKANAAAGEDDDQAILKMLRK